MNSICNQKVHLFLAELEEKSLPLQINNKITWIKCAFEDLIYCIPQLFQSIQNMVQLHKRLWEPPIYILLNQENLNNFQSSPPEMPENYKKSLLRNLHAIQEVCTSLNLQEKIYYCTKSRSDTTAAAEAEATGEIVIYDEICTSSPEAAQTTLLHEWTHLQHKDGYTCWSLKMAAAAFRIFTLYISPWSLLLISPILTYGTMKYSQYCEYRADKTAAQMSKNPSDFIQELYDTAEQITLDTIAFIEKNHPNSPCTVSNYYSLSKEEQSLIVFKVSDLGIRSTSSPRFEHPSYSDRYKQLL